MPHCMRSGKYAEAEPDFHESLEGFRRVPGDDHPDTPISNNNMDDLLGLMGKHDEAWPDNLGALVGRRRVLGNDHPDTRNSIHSMSALLNQLSRHDEAAELLQAGEAGSPPLGSPAGWGTLMNYRGSA